MDPAAGRNAHIPPPGIKRPVDSYHRQLHEEHGVLVEPPPSIRDPGGFGGSVDGNGAHSRSASGERFSGVPRRDSWRDRITSSYIGNGIGRLSHVASFFDSERLARSAVQSEGTYSPRGPNRMRWPFLGSIKSSPTSPVSATHPAAGGSDADDTNQIPLPWRPLFLHRRTLIAFAALFAVLLAGLEAALAVSNLNDGLRNFNQVSRFLWQYGVVLVFVVVAALWSRVEHQAAVAAPWMRMSSTPTELDKSLLLDYVSRFPPLAMYRAARNKDWLVACTVAVGLLLKLVIVFSTAMITSGVISVSDRSAKITLAATFSQSNNGLQNVGSVPYYAMVGLQANNMSFPNGVAPRVAYLPFSSSESGLTGLNATVEGFAGGMDCETATMTLDESRYTNGTVEVDISVSQDKCKYSQVISSVKFNSTSNQSLPRMFLLFGQGSCGSSTKSDDQRIVVTSGTIDFDFDDLKTAEGASSSSTIGAKFSKSAAFMCTPTYAIAKVDVSKDPQDLLSATLTGAGGNSTFDGVKPWDIAQAHFDSYKTNLTAGVRAYSKAQHFYDDGAIFSANELVYAALAMRAKESGSPPKVSTLSEASTVQQLAQDYFQQYSALIARYSMMEQASTSSIGTSASIRRRVFARDVPVHLMVALLAICLGLTGAAIFFAPKKGFLPRDPSALVDLAAIIAHSHPLVECLRGMGTANSDAIRTRLVGSTYTTGAEGHEKIGDPNLGYFHIFGGREPPINAMSRRAARSRWRPPLYYHALIRLLYTILLVCVIIAFEITLRSSESHDGLRTLENDDDYLAWTAVPALLLLLIALYMAQVEWWTRFLAPFVRLTNVGRFRDTIGLNVIDATRPLAFWRAAKIKDYAVMSAMLGACTAALFTVASAALFEPAPVDASTSVLLRTGDFFANSLASSSADPVCTDCNNDTLAASMILAGDAPYPRFTYENLNFQSLSVKDGTTLDDNSNVSVTLTAVRPNMSCRLYLDNEISANLTLSYTTDDNIVNPLQISLKGEVCGGSGSSAAVLSTEDVTAERYASADNSAPFGLGQGKTNSSSQCSDWLYVWGRLANTNSDKMSVGSVSALACNESIEAVTTSVNLYGSSLRIDSADPPAPSESTVHDTTVAIPDLDYSLLFNVTHTGLLDAFFAVLNASTYAVSDDVFASTSSADAAKVQAAIVSQHGVIRTQSLNFKSRRHLSSSGSFPTADGQSIVSGVDPDASVSGAVPLVNGAFVFQRTRLRQSAVATRILQGLAGAALVLHMLCWAFTRKNRLPRRPTNIASVAALLVDGNLLKILPREAQWQTRKEIKDRLCESQLADKFELDWSTSRIRTKRDGRKVKIGEGTFGIRAIAPGELDIKEDVEMKPIERKKQYPSVRHSGRPEAKWEGNVTDVRSSVQRPPPTYGWIRDETSRPVTRQPSNRKPRRNTTTEAPSVPIEYLQRRASRGPIKRSQSQRHAAAAGQASGAFPQRRPSERQPPVQPPMQPAVQPPVQPPVQHPLQPHVGMVPVARNPGQQRTEDRLRVMRTLREQRSMSSATIERMGVVRSGTGTIGSDSVERRSVMLGSESSHSPKEGNIADDEGEEEEGENAGRRGTQRESTATSGEQKEIVKVWWAP